MWKIEIYNPQTGITENITNKVLKISPNTKLDNESNTFELICKNLTKDYEFCYISIYKDSNLKYNGIILNQTDEEVFPIKKSSLSCVDWSFIFSRRVVAEKYTTADSTQGRPDLILIDIVSKYAPEFTTNNIRQATETSIIQQDEVLSFPYIYLLDAFKKVLNHLSDWHWYVDPSKDVHFFKGYETDGVTFGPDEQGKYNFNINSLRVSYKGEQTANRVWIVGAKRSAPNFIEQYFTGDGKQRYFSLAYEPNYTEIYVDGVLKKSKLEINDDGNQDFLINKKDKIIYIPDNISTPFTGEIKVKYKPTIQVVDYFENPASIATYGLIEKVIKDRDIADRLSARKIGKAEIKKKSIKKRVVSISTRENVEIGQRCYLDINIQKTVNGELIKWDIQGYFLVKSVSSEITVKDEVHSVELEEIL